MSEIHRLELEELGLSAGEAQVYLALLRTAGGLGASAVATTTGIPRTSIYPILNALLEKGMVEGEAGYGSRFRAVRPKDALPSLIVREKEEILQRERLAGELVGQLEALAEPADASGEAEIIQVLRDPRLIADRFERLQLEAEQQVEVFIKAPIFNPRYTNPTQEKAMRRGVRFRGLYERAIVDSPEIQPYVARWIAAGEEARVHDGELPHKLAIFDRQYILMPLITPAGQGRTLFIKHPQLARTLGIAFDALWDRSEPMRGAEPNKPKSSSQQTPKEQGGRMSRSTNHR
jgi:sugar-specific transcriptional regulator TrmB